MKLFYTLLLMLFLSVTAVARNSPHIFTLNWQGGILYGSEWRLSRFSGIKADAGITIVGIFISDANYVFYITPGDKKIQIELLLGITNASAPVTFENGMIAFGGDLLTSFGLSKRISLDLKIGAGFPLFIEKGKDVIRDTSFPLDLWPDAAISIRIKSKKALTNE